MKRTMLCTALFFSVSVCSADTGFKPSYPSPNDPRTEYILRACINGKVHAKVNDGWELFCLAGSLVDCATEPYDDNHSQNFNPPKIINPQKYCVPNPKEVKVKPPEEWHKGGTLHQSSAAQWKSASAANRLATSADFASRIRPSRSMADLKVRAFELETCISEAVDDPRLDIMRIPDVAASCAILLGY